MRTLSPSKKRRHDAPSLDKYLLRSVRRTGGCCGTDICSQLLQCVIWTEGHSAEGSSSMDCLWAGSHGLTASIHRMKIRGRIAKEHGDVLRFARGRVNAVGIPGIGRRSSASANVTRTKMIFEGWVGDVVIRRRLARGRVIRHRRRKR